MALAGALLALGCSLVGTGTARAAGSGHSGTAQAAANRVICYEAHVAGIGWESAYSCGGVMAGTTGEGRAIEALRFITVGMGGLCARAHVSTIGWQSWICVGDNTTLEIGTTGQNLPIEAVEFQTEGGSVAANAHLSGFGWQGWIAGGRITVGTTGQNRSIEAIMVTA
ncbi:hypothetical protein ACFO3J_18015 [Streptomyces polygonati]|uniref:Clostridial hydrophobic W n=1 Tax=Streptomyces polygonati TaxID=1617087 RepID=A0ABV8HQM1_9ACTN